MRPNLSRRADHSLEVLRRELHDVGGASVGESLAMSSGTRFVDMWFDNIFNGLTVRSQINDARDKPARASA